MVLVEGGGFGPPLRWLSEPFIKFCAVAASPLGQPPLYVRGIAFRFLFENQRASQQTGLIRSIKLFRITISGLGAAAAAVIKLDTLRSLKLH